MQKDFAPRFYHLTFCLYTLFSLYLYHYAWVSLMDHLGSHYMLPSLLRCLTFDTFTLQNTSSDSEPGVLQFFCLMLVSPTFKASSTPTGSPVQPSTGAVLNIL